MMYMGGLTFDSNNPSNFPQIHNLVAAKWFGLALFERHGLDGSMKDVLYNLVATGSPISILKGYCSLMRQVGDAFAKIEENHRDSLWIITILENPAIQPKAEYQVRKVRSLRLTLIISYRIVCMYHNNVKIGSRQRRRGLRHKRQ
jgi:hypothetical protein